MDSTAGNLLSRYGQILQIDGEDVLSVSGADTYYTDPVYVPKTGVAVMIEMLWSGVPVGAIGLQVRGHGPWQDVPAAMLASSAQPDGTNYTGDLEADDINAELVGCALIQLDGFAGSCVRGVYVHASGAGEVRCFAKVLVTG